MKNNINLISNIPSTVTPSNKFDKSEENKLAKKLQPWTPQPPLMTLFKAPITPETAAIQENKEKQWELHFSEYGRGMTIYRTIETAKLVISGVPQSLRGEVWLTFSGNK